MKFTVLVGKVIVCFAAKDVNQKLVTVRARRRIRCEAFFFKFKFKVTFISFNMWS